MSYSPTLGRFMQQDPIGYADGVNDYQLEHGSPLDGVDPLGLGEPHGIMKALGWDGGKIFLDKSMFGVKLALKPEKDADPWIMQPVTEFNYAVDAFALQDSDGTITIYKVPDGADVIMRAECDPKTGNSTVVWKNHERGIFSTITELTKKQIADDHYPPAITQPFPGVQSKAMAEMLQKVGALTTPPISPIPSTQPSTTQPSGATLPPPSTLPTEDNSAHFYHTRRHPTVMH